MDHVKIGQLIYRLRKEKHLTQLQLANQMNISDKTISKWKRGLGCPELSLLTGDSIMLRKQYPESGLQVRIPVFAHGKLL